jgi:hypothetical protein
VVSATWLPPMPRASSRIQEHSEWPCAASSSCRDHFPSSMLWVCLQELRLQGAGRRVGRLIPGDRSHRRVLEGLSCLRSPNLGHREVGVRRGCPCAIGGWMHNRDQHCRRWGSPWEPDLLVGHLRRRTTGLPPGIPQANCCCSWPTVANADSHNPRS